jgi:murein DD-endopeptidase MepM/ murein hydrolase activator NlpD
MMSFRVRENSFRLFRLPLLRKTPSLCVIVGALGLVLFSGACSTPTKIPFTHLKYWNGSMVPGYYYPVQRGDTLASIAQYFGCEMGLLAEINDILPQGALGARERVFIPRTGTGFPQSYYAKPRRSDAIQPSPSSKAKTAETETRRPAGSLVSTSLPWGQQPQAPTVVALPAAAPAAGPSLFLNLVPLPPQPGSQSKPSAPVSAKPAESVPPASSRQRGIQIAQAYSKRRFPASSQVAVPNAPRFQWPVEGTLTSPFNVRSSGRRLHLGIDIANKKGTPVRAACSGRVIYSDSKYLPSMGNMILIEHAGGWVTLYSHNERNLVKEGDVVETGQVIAAVGATGNATGPHLHFEIRKNADTPVNPIEYLPPRR